MHLLTSDFSFSTRGERHNSYKSFVSYYPNNTPNVWHISWCLFSIHLHWLRPEKLNHCHNGRNSTLWQRTPFSAPMAEAPLSACMVHSQLPTDFIQNLQILKTIASRHDVIHITAISYLGFIMTVVFVISFVYECKLYPILCTWTLNPNSSKPNQTEW